MPRRSKVMALPAEVRQRLEQLLIERGFSGYSELADWLQEQGHDIRRSALHAYGSKLERKIESVRVASEQARVLVEALPDEAGAMADASIRMVQQRMFELLLAAEGDDLEEIASAARAIADTARAGTSIRQERRKALKEAAERAGKAAAAEGLSPGGAAAIRAAIEGGA